MSKRAMRRARRKTKGALGKAKAEADMLRAMNHARCREVARLGERVYELEKELSEIRSASRHWTWTGTMFIPA